MAYGAAVNITREQLISIATEAGQQALASFRNLATDTIHFKSEIDLVTDVDRSVQAFLIDRLTTACPGARFLAEEQDVHPTLTDEPTFIIDPIDGTTNFVHGVPHFCVSVAYAEAKKPVLATVVAPALSEVFSAERGKGAFCGTRQITVSRTDNPQHALACTGLFGGDDAKRESGIRMLIEIHPHLRDLRRMGAAALDLCYVAAGRFDLFWEGSLSPWDVAAGMLIVEEAGGIVTGVRGESDDVLFARSVLAANPELHRWFLSSTKPRT